MRTLHSVKKILAIVLSIALLIGAAPLAFAGTLPEELKLVTVSDLHYFPATLAGTKGEAYYNYLNGSNAPADDMDAILDALFESLKYARDTEGVKYVVLCGDLTTNGEYEGHRVLSEKLAAFEEESGMTVLVTNGNHDINNSVASEFTNNRKNPARVTTAKEFAEFYGAFGYDDAYHTYKELGCGTQGCLTYSLKTEEGYRFIFADGGKYSADATEDMTEEHETSGAFTEEQLGWLLDEIADAKAAGEIPMIFTHWNLNSMNWFHGRLLQGFVIDDAYKLAEAFADAGCHYVFSGHQHQSDVSVTYSDAGEPLYSVITPTVTEFPFAYRLTSFVPGENGKIEATFDQFSCDEGTAVKAAGGNYYPTPYRTTGFAKQYGGPDASEYLMYMIKRLLGDIFGDIRAEGSIVTYIEKTADIDIEETVNGFLLGGIRSGDTDVLTGANVMKFLDDIDLQLMEKYVYDLPYTYSVIEKAVKNLCNVKITDTPCSKYVEEYGFGSKTEGATVGDLLLDVMTTMYYGNEDISDDAFLTEMLEISQRTTFVDGIFAAVKEFVAEDVLVDEILANVDLHLNAFFLEHAASIADYVQLVYTLLLALLGSGVFKAHSSTELGTAVRNLFLDGGNISLKKLADTVLDTGLISYGDTVDELFDSLLDQFFGPEQKKAAAYQLYVLIEGLVHDDTPDFGVTYTYDGPEEIVPTKEDMRLPSNVQISLTDDTATSFTLTWFTKYSVTGSDIEVVKKGEAFTGALTEENVTAETTEETFGGYGFDFGTFGILPWSEDVVKHVVTVSGLEADTEYAFRFGDAGKNFMCEGSYKTSPEQGGQFTFINVTDSDGTCPDDYANGLAAALNAAKDHFPGAAFALHSGNIVKKGINDLQWTWALDGSADALSSMALMYTAGTNDADGSYAAVKHLSQPAGEQYTENGVYYSFDYSSVHFIVINTNYTEDGTINAEQLSWLEQDLAENDQYWTVLSLYAPVTGAAAENTVVKGQLLDLMRDYPIDLILQGGGRCYVRTAYLHEDEPLEGFDIKIVDFDGDLYTVALTTEAGVTAMSGGTSGTYADFAPEEDRYLTSLVIDRPVFSAVTVKDHQLVFGAYEVNEDGTSKRIDEFGIEKNIYHVLYGDADLNGVVEAADARLALRFSVGLETPNDLQRIAADVTDDGEIAPADARKILRASVGLTEFDPAYIDVTENDLRG